MEHFTSFQWHNFHKIQSLKHSWKEPLRGFLDSSNSVVEVGIVTPYMSKLHDRVILVPLLSFILKFSAFVEKIEAPLALALGPGASIRENTVCTRSRVLFRSRHTRTNERTIGNPRFRTGSYRAFAKQWGSRWSYTLPYIWPKHLS